MFPRDAAVRAKNDHDDREHHQQVGGFPDPLQGQSPQHVGQVTRHRGDRRGCDCSEGDLGDA